MHCASSKKDGVHSDFQTYVAMEPLPPGAWLRVSVLWATFQVTRAQGRERQWGCGTHPAVGFYWLTTGEATVETFTMRQALARTLCVFTNDVTDGLKYLYTLHLLKLLVTHNGLESWQEGDENFKGHCHYQWSQSYGSKWAHLTVKSTNNVYDTVRGQERWVTHGTGRDQRLLISHKAERTLWGDCCLQLLATGGFSK